MKHFVLVIFSALISQAALAHEGATCHSLYLTVPDLNSKVISAHIGGPDFNVKFNPKDSTYNIIKEKFMSFMVSMDPNGQFGTTMKLKLTLSHTFSQTESTFSALSGGVARLTFPADASRMIGDEYLVGAILTCELATDACPGFVTCGNYLGKLTQTKSNGEKMKDEDYVVNLNSGPANDEVTWSSKWVNGAATMRYTMKFNPDGSFRINQSGRGIGNGTCQNMTCHYTYCLTPGGACLYLVTGAISFEGKALHFSERTQAGPHDAITEGVLQGNF